jgi:AraC family transcriptional regulator, transcriptional activator FtrA
MPQTSPCHKVVALVVPNGSLFEMAVAAEIFGQQAPCESPWWYQFRIASPIPGKVRLDLATIEVPHGLPTLRTAQTIVVPGWPDQATATPTLIGELQRAVRRGARIVSYCTGAFLLAEAGLLDGLVATTHWGALERFSTRFPNINVDPNVLYVDNGAILTAAGSAAAIDVSLHLIRRDLGAKVAASVARQMVTAPHRSGGQAQFVPSHADSQMSNSQFGELLEWMIGHLGEDLSLQAIARQANTSSRTLSRQFASHVGVTPHQWLVQQRVLKAQNLLEQGYSVEEVAQRVGFKSGSAMRPHFTRLTSTSASAYQRSFSSGVRTITLRPRNSQLRDQSESPSS